MRMQKILGARRRLLITLTILAVLVIISYVNNIHSIKAQSNTGKAVVGITKIAFIPSATSIETGVRGAVALAGGLPSNIGPGKKVVIQPNLVNTDWASDSGVVTNLYVIRTVVKMVKEKGVATEDITICEGTAAFKDDSNRGGFSDRQMTLKAFKDVGLDADGDMIEDATGVKLVDANYAGEYDGTESGVYPNYPDDYDGQREGQEYNYNYVTKMYKSGLLIDRAYFIPKCVAECDALIRVPVLKNHNLAGITGALKLAYGLAPSDIYHIGGATYYKWNLLHYKEPWDYDENEEALYNADGQCDLTYLRPPDFVVMDALVGVTNGPVGDGSGIAYPAGGNIKCIIAGKDPVAVDTVGALVCGYKTSSILSLQEAVNDDYQLGVGNLADIVVKGKHIYEVRRWFPDYGCAVHSDDIAGPLIDGLNIVNNSHVGEGDLVVMPTNPHDIGSATDPAIEPSGICKAELYVDGLLVDIGSSVEANYAVKWNIDDSVAEGTHTIKYILYDNMFNENNSTQSTRTVYVHKGSEIREAFNLEDTTSVTLSPVIVTGMGTVIDNRTFFVSSNDSACGLRVQYSTAAPAFTSGDRLLLSGTLGSVDGQRMFNCTSYTTLAPAAQVKPKMMSNKTVGGAAINDYTLGIPGATGAYNLGSLIRVAGIVSAGGSDYFYVNDGSMGGANKLKVKCGSFAQPTPGKFVSVVGFSCAENVSGVIKSVVVMRSAGDFVSYN